MVIARVSGSRRRQIASALWGVRPSRISSSISDAIESVCSAYWERSVSGLRHKWAKMSRNTHMSAHATSVSTDSVPLTME